MNQRYLIDIQLEPKTAFVPDINSQVPSSSAMSVGKFFDVKTQESWFGKCDCAISESMTKRDAYREKIANDIYGYYGISVPRLRISQQPIPQAIKKTYGLKINDGYYVMSRWLDRFDVYGYLPQFETGQTHHELKITVENQTRTLKERGLGHILAVAHWLNDIDVMNPSGKNVGYQLQLDPEGKLYAKSCKIDPGYAFSEFSKMCNRILMLKSSEDFPKQLNPFIVYLKQINGNIRARWQENHAFKEQQITDQKKCEKILSFFQTTNSIEITEGDLFNKVALSCEYVISNIAISDEIQLSTQGSEYTFGKLPTATQQEYLITLKKIILTSDEQITAFFSCPEIKEVFENEEVKQLLNFVPVSTLIEQLKSRRDRLAKLHETALKMVGEINPIVGTTSIPLLLQRLYCQAKLDYETDVKEKAVFYVPLDVMTSPHSDARVPIHELWSTFLGIPHFGELHPSTTIAATSGTNVTTSSTSTGMIHTITTLTTTGTQAPHLKTYTPVLLLLGASGSGKSLATQLLVTDLWKAFLNDPQNPIPLRIELKQFSERTVGQGIINTLLDEYHYSPQELHQLQAYRFVFILDGYDEMANQAKINLLLKHEASEAQYGKWQAQFIITCRDSYFQGLDQSVFYPIQGISGLEIRYLSPLTPSYQIDYLMGYKAFKETGTSAKPLPDYAGILKENPYLHELLSNPFLLRIFRDALPQWQQDYPHESLKNLTSYNLYTAFLDQWFVSEALRLSIIKAKYLADQLPQRFLNFSLRLAFEMHVQKVDEVNAEITDQTLWNQFFSDQNETISEARAGSPLQRINQSRYSFVHKSFLEYFVARGLWEALEKNDLVIWNQRLLPETWEILQFLVEHWKNRFDQKLQDRLWDWIQGSKTNDQQNIAAANAITVLNHGGLSFIGEYGDLTGVKIPGADLQNALLDHTCFQGANLRGVNLSHAFLRGTNFRQADLTDIELGELPSLKFTRDIKAMAYNTDGGLLGIAFADNIELWQGDPLKKVATLSPNKSTMRLTSIAFDPTNRYIASGANHSVILWEIYEKKQIADIWHSGDIYSVVFNSTGTHVGFGGNNKNITLCDVTPNNSLGIIGTHLVNLEGHTDRVNSLSYNSTGKYLVSGSWDNTLRLWEAETGKLLRTLEGHTSRVNCVAFDPSGKYIISGSNDCSLRLWDVETGKLLLTLEHTDRVNCVGFHPSGKYIISGSNDCSLRLWDAETGKLLLTLEEHTSRVGCVAFHPSGKYIASSGNFQDNTIRFWPMQYKKPFRPLEGPSEGIFCLAFDPISMRIVSGSNNGIIQLWKFSGEELFRTLGHTDTIFSAVFDPTGTYIASCGNNTIQIWEISNNTLINMLQYPTSGHCVSFDSTGKHIILESNDNILQLLEFKTGKSLLTFKGHTNLVTCVSFAPSGKWIISGSYDKTLRLWDSQSGKLLLILEGHTSYVKCVSFHPSGRYIASGSGDSTLRLWETETGNLLHIFEGHTLDVSCVAFDPSGKWIISGSYDKTLRLWEIKSGKLLAILKGHTQSVQCVSFELTATCIVSGGSDKAILAWRSVNQDNTQWQVIWRCIQNPALTAPDASFHQATISLDNQKVLEQHGASQKTPEYTDYRQSFWAKPQEKNKSSVLMQAISTTPIVPAPLKTAFPTTAISPSFEASILQLVKALKTAIDHSPEPLDSQAASIFISTFLGAIRKGTLQALQASPREHGIPTGWITWLTDVFENNPTLKTLLNNPHPNSSRFELELLQENLSDLLQRYFVEETDEDEMDAQEQDGDPIQTPTSGLSPTHTTSNPEPENKGMCYVM